MLRLCAVALTLSLACVSRSSYALDASLLQMFGQKVAEQMCADGGKWLLCYSITARSCPTVAQRLVTPCVTESFSGVSEQLEYDQGLAIAQKFQNCVNTRFEKEYGARKLNTPECARPPAHLQDKP
jgi:hypothetical protein